MLKQGVNSGSNLAPKRFSVRKTGFQRVPVTDIRLAAFPAKIHFAFVQHGGEINRTFLKIFDLNFPGMKFAKNVMDPGHVSNHLVGAGTAQILASLGSWSHGFIQIAYAPHEGVDLLEPVAQGREQPAGFVQRIMFGELIAHGLIHFLEFGFNLGLDVLRNIADGVGLLQVLLRTFLIAKSDVDLT